MRQLLLESRFNNSNIPPFINKIREYYYSPITNVLLGSYPDFCDVYYDPCYNACYGPSYNDHVDFPFGVCDHDRDNILHKNLQLSTTLNIPKKLQILLS